VPFGLVWHELGIWLDEMGVAVSRALEESKTVLASQQSCPSALQLEGCIPCIFLVLRITLVSVQVLEAAGITDPLVLAVAYTARARSVSAVRTLREHFKETPIFARALDSLHAAELRTAGAVTLRATENLLIFARSYLSQLSLPLHGHVNCHTNGCLVHAPVL